MHACIAMENINNDPSTCPCLPFCLIPFFTVTYKLGFFLPRAEALTEETVQSLARFLIPRYAVACILPISRRVICMCVLDTGPGPLPGLSSDNGKFAKLHK